MPHQQETQASSQIVLARNPEKKNRLELLFPQAPQSEITSRLSSHGFRWAKQKVLWFAEETEKRKAFAESLITPSLESKPEVSEPTPQTEDVKKGKGRPKKERPPVETETEVKEVWYQVRSTLNGLSKLTQRTKSQEKALVRLDELLTTLPEGTVLELLANGEVAHTQTVPQEETQS
jgi:hypothetical protein